MEAKRLISLLGTATDEEIPADDDNSRDVDEDNAGVLSFTTRFELITIDGELLIPLLDIPTDEEIIADDETTTVLSDDNTGSTLIYCQTGAQFSGGLELIVFDGEVLIEVLDTSTGDKTTEDDKNNKDLAEDKGALL
ncbi:hypothetical protein ACROYT_G026704 [Oculina patagonica]